MSCLAKLWLFGRGGVSVVRQTTEVVRGSISVASFVGLCCHVWGIKKLLLLLAVDKTNAFNDCCPVAKI